MRRLAVVVIAVAMIASIVVAQKKSSAKGGGNEEQQISSLMDLGKQAALKGDTSWQEQHMADDFAGISSKGERITKSESIANRKSGDMKYQAIDEQDRKIRVYGNAAIVNLKANIKGTYKGQDMSGDYWSTFVWAKQGGQWKLVSMQSTPVAGPNK